MRSTITIRNLTLGEGLPKICVPLTGTTLEELSAQLAAALAGPCDLVEWRADYFRESQEPGVLLAVLGELRKATDKPIIFTLRSAAEGGMSPLKRHEILAVLRDVIEQGEADFVDIEFFEEDGSLEDAKMEFLAEAAHGNGKRVIFSNHDFDKTPDLESIVKRLLAMAQMGADLPKVAYMPRKPEDVLVLLEAARLAGEEALEGPFIALSMGEMGRETRVCGGSFGSAVTFAAPPGSAPDLGSAPGQMDARELARCLAAYYNEKE